VPHRVPFPYSGNAHLLPVLEPRGTQDGRSLRAVAINPISSCTGASKQDRDHAILFAATTTWGSDVTPLEGCVKETRWKPGPRNTVMGDVAGFGALGPATGDLATRNLEVAGLDPGY
jgi:hypothetical protein